MKTLAAIAGMAHLGPAEDEVLFPWRPVRWWNLAARARRRRRQRDYRELPCCCGYQYGFALMAGRTEPITIRGGRIRPDLPMGPDEVLAWIERRVNPRGPAQYVVDYIAHIQGGYAPCPDCSTEPPLHLRVRWVEHCTASAELAARYGDSILGLPFSDAVMTRTLEDLARG